MTSNPHWAPPSRVVLSIVATVVVVFSTGVITGARLARDERPLATHVPTQVPTRVAPSGAVRHAPHPSDAAVPRRSERSRADTPANVSTDIGPRPARTVRGRVARAARLHEQATALQIAGRWRASAEHHRQAAALYGTDTSAFTCLQLAGNMHFYDGNLASARAAMQAAADHALAGGRAAAAADALLKVGVIAREAGDSTAAGVLAARAESLVRSPDVTPAQRASLRSGITRAFPTETLLAVPTP